MTDGPTREEMQRLYDTIDDGFKGVHDEFKGMHARLDVLNGRTQQAEIAAAELRQRMTNVEKEVFVHPRRRVHDSDGSSKRRDSAVMALGIAVMTVIVKLAFFLGDSTIEAFKNALKVK